VAFPLPAEPPVAFPSPAAPPVATPVEVPPPQAPARAKRGGTSIAEIQKGLRVVLLDDFTLMIAAMSKCQTTQRKREPASLRPNDAGNWSPSNWQLTATQRVA